MEAQTERGVKSAVVLAGGFCDTDAVRADSGTMAEIAGAYAIAADSGLMTAEKLGIAPDLIVGDFDSYTGELPDGPEIVRVPAEKDVTDTVLACQIAEERGYGWILILGGTGGRADHSLSNILWLYSLKKRGIDARLTDGRNEFRVLRNEAVSVPREEGWYFSLFAMEAGCAVTAVGCRYPLPDPVPLGWDNPSFAVSNEVTEERAVVKASGTVLLVRSRK